MIGKRRFVAKPKNTFKKRYAGGSRPLTMITNDAVNIPAYTTPVYGRGYNPKATAVAAPPPGAERKWFDTNVAFAPMAAHGSLPTTIAPGYQKDSLLLMSRGDGPNNREGAKICLTSLDIRGSVGTDRNSASTFSAADLQMAPTQFRVIVYIDTQANGANAPVETIITPQTGNPFDSFNNLVYSGRYKTLMDKFILVRPGSAFWDGTSYHSTGGIAHFKKHVALNLPVTYTANEGAITSVVGNNIGVLCFSQYAPHHAISFSARVRFTDY